MRCHSLLSSVAITLLAACAATDVAAPVLGIHRRPGISAVERAQVEFDRGLLYCYGFNHDEAVRCFRRAAAADPQCAMAQWGIAYALGPNINKPQVDEASAAQAHDAASRAATLRRHAKPADQALITALAARCESTTADRAAQDRAYAAAMRDVARQFPEDPDVGALFAEALLDLAPWDQWTADGEPKEFTAEILAVLERVLAQHPDHPLALHLYIHATEASPHPERALTAASRLPLVAPGLGHLVHMPAHTLQRTGRYSEALQANLRGAELDERYFAEAGPQGIYHGYHGHNLHFAAYAAMFAGDSAAALDAARRLVASIPPHLAAKSPEFFDGWPAVPHEVLVRFGRWREVLEEPVPAASYPVARALGYFAHAVAKANLGELHAALALSAQFEVCAAAVPEGAVVGLTPAAPVLKIAGLMLDGEILFRRGARPAAFAALREAVAAEDGLRYDEPRGWMMPVRHALGALLFADARYDEAEAVYREDLRRNPENGWALRGLADCLQKGGDAASATAVEARFARAWSSADVRIEASCYCAR